MKSSLHIGRIIQIWGTLLSLAWVGCSGQTGPREPSRPLGELRVCSENLDRFGEFRPPSQSARSGKKRRRTAKQDPEEQLSVLVERMRAARCDVVGLQEVTGRSRSEASQTASRIAAALSAATERRFQSFAGESEDAFIRNGLLVATDISEKIEFFSFGAEPLERLVSYGPIGSFLRAPVGVVLRIRSRDRPDRLRTVFVLNIHFKSRSFGFKDVQHLDFETLRMEMAETTRRLFLRERERLGKDSIAVLVGDRNNGIGSATAEILSGVRLLEDFRGAGRCRLEKSLRPLCESQPNRPPLLRPLLEMQGNSDSREAPLASYRYRGREEVLDEILIPADLLNLVTDGKKRLRIGVEGEFFRGSDHKLTWVSFSF